MQMKKYKNIKLKMRRLLTLFVAIALFSAPAFSQKKDTYRVRTVVIDPGHGGAKPGALGGRIQEKELTLSIAKKFGKLITDNYPDVKVIYTRTSDVDISLAERAHIANRNKADLFVSIHINSHPTAIPTGVETFVMGLSESRANLEVAKKENADILLEADYKNNEAYKGFDPNAPESFVMLAMYQNAFIDKSLNFAQAIQTQYKKNLKTINRGVKQAELFVLYKTTCPSVLTEVGFISNPAEEAFMMSDEGQAKIAVSLFNAFMTYKATEEGINKIANPKIELPGYNVTPPATVKPEPEPAPAVAKKVEPEPDPIVVEKVKTAPERPLPTRELAPKMTVEPKVEAPAEQPKVAAPAEQPKVEAPVEQPKVETLVEPEPITEIIMEPVPEPAPEPAPKVETKPTPAPVVETPRAASIAAPEASLKAPKNTAAKTGDYFTVQFLASGTELREGDPAFSGLENIMVTRNGQLYCYSVGRFATFGEANEYSKELQRSTPFKDAWAVRRKADAVQPTVLQNSTTPKEQKDIKETKELKSTPKPETRSVAQTETKSSTLNAADRGTHYRIQFCTARRRLKPGDPDLHGIKDIRTTQSGSVYIYSCGNYTSLAEARKRLATIQKTTPFKDAFLFGIKDGRRFKVE